MLEAVILPISLWFVLGIAFFIFGIYMVVRAGGYCLREAKTVIEEGWHHRSGKCIRSLRDLGVFGVFLIIYMAWLFVVSAYVILYGFQFGWVEVHTHDLALSVSYIGLIIILAFMRKL